MLCVLWKKWVVMSCRGHNMLKNKKFNKLRPMQFNGWKLIIIFKLFRVDKWIAINELIRCVHYISKSNLTLSLKYLLALFSLITASKLISKEPIQDLYFVSWGNEHLNQIYKEKFLFLVLSLPFFIHNRWFIFTHDYFHVMKLI